MHHAPFISGLFTVQFSPPSVQYTLSDSSGRKEATVTRTRFVQDFFQRECWAHHPKPYADFMRWRADEDARWAADSSRLIPGG